MNLQGFIFDLDGTLLNTLEDIADAENQALAELNLPPRPVEEYRWIVGGGADDIARRLLPLSLQTPEHIKAFVQSFRAYYHQNWNCKTCLYPGIADLLTTLQHKCCKIAILSNKPEEFVHKIVDYYFPDWQGALQPRLFTHVFGQRHDYPTKPNPALALEIARAWQLEPATIGFIGDSDIDIFTAQNAGMAGIGAEWGFRGKQELVASGAQILLKNPLDLIMYTSDKKEPE